MSNKEISLRSILFLVIGILLLLSLIICIYIVHGERDLVKVSAEVIEVREDSEGTGKNEVVVSYEIDGVPYKYDFYYKDNVHLSDHIDVYYHENNVTSLQSFKTPKIIFLCPIVGLVLCVFGVFELFRKIKDDPEENDFNTKVIAVVGNTEQLKIITDDTEEISYVKTEEEVQEAPVKTITKTEVQAPEEVVYQEQVVYQEVPVTYQEQVVYQEEPVYQEQVVYQEEPVYQEEVVYQDVTESYESNEIVLPMETTSTNALQDLNIQNVDDDDVYVVAGTQPKTPIQTVVVQSTAEDIVIPMDKMVKKEEIKVEAKEENATTKETSEEKKEETKTIKKIIPKYYYLSGDALVYEELGKELRELDLLSSKRIVKTINKNEEIVKVTIYFDEVVCVLMNMKESDLVKTANLIHNRMASHINDYEEEIEHREF